MSNAGDRQRDGLSVIAISLVLCAFLGTARYILGHVGVRLFFVVSGFLIPRLLPDACAASEFQPVSFQVE